MFYVPFITVVALFKILLCRSGKENYFKLVKTPSSRVVSFKIISQNSAPTNQKFFTNEFLETGNIAQLLKNVAVKKLQTWRNYIFAISNFQTLAFVYFLISVDGLLFVDYT